MAARMADSTGATVAIKFSWMSLTHCTESLRCADMDYFPCLLWLSLFNGHGPWFEDDDDDYCCPQATWYWRRYWWMVTHLNLSACWWWWWGRWWQGGGRWWWWWWWWWGEDGCWWLVNDDSSRAFRWDYFSNSLRSNNSARNSISVKW